MIAQLSVTQLAQTLGVAFALGMGLLLCLSMLPASRAVARQLWPLLGSEAVILGAGVLPWLLPPLGTFACLLCAAGRIGFESGSVHGQVAGRKLAFACMAVLVFASAFAWFSSTDLLVMAGGALLIAALAAMAVTGTSLVARSMAHFAIFPLLPLMAFSHVAAQPRQLPLIILALLLVEIFDSFSLLGGRLYGRTPLVPRLSPKKTWEGLATGAAALFGVILTLVVAFRLPVGPMLVCGVAVFISAIAGDLLGSLAKRRAGVKDYPPVMSLQGGLLDIMDSWLVAVPSLAALLWLTGCA